MNASVPDLLSQGLVMSALGMGLVFAALGVLWGLIELLTGLLRDQAEVLTPSGSQPSETATNEHPDVAALTVERARVAALVAGALLSNAVSLGLEPPAGPTFEHGRVAPSWVVSNRSQALHGWTPLRRPEGRNASSNPY